MIEWLNVRMLVPRWFALLAVLSMLCVQLRGLTIMIEWCYGN